MRQLIHQCEGVEDNLHSEVMTSTWLPVTASEIKEWIWRADSKRACEIFMLDKSVTKLAVIECIINQQKALNFFMWNMNKFMFGKIDSKHSQQQRSKSQW